MLDLCCKWIRCCCCAVGAVCDLSVHYREVKNVVSGSEYVPTSM